MKDFEKDAEKLVNYVNLLEEQGAILLKGYSKDPPPTAGIFESVFSEWKSGTEYKKNDLFVYNGMTGYVKQPRLISQIEYEPFTLGAEALYGARPKPDENGIYPYVYNMGIYAGMLVRGNDGNVYRSKTGTYETPTELLYEPKDVPAMLERVIE